MKLFLLFSFWIVSVLSHNGPHSSDTSVNITATGLMTASGASDITMEFFGPCDTAFKWSELKMVHERQLHVQLASQSMNYYSHVHPEDWADIQADATVFTVNPLFPKAGQYLMHMGLEVDMTAYCARQAASCSCGDGSAVWPLSFSKVLNVLGANGQSDPVMSDSATVFLNGLDYTSAGNQARDLNLRWFNLNDLQSSTMAGSSLKVVMDGAVGTSKFNSSNCVGGAFTITTSMGGAVNLTQYLHAPGHFWLVNHDFSQLESYHYHAMLPGGHSMMGSGSDMDMSGSMSGSGSGSMNMSGSMSGSGSMDMSGSMSGSGSMDMSGGDMDMGGSMSLDSYVNEIDAACADANNNIMMDMSMMMTPTQFAGKFYAGTALTPVQAGNYSLFMGFEKENSTLYVARFSLTIVDAPDTSSANIMQAPLLLLGLVLALY